MVRNIRPIAIAGIFLSLSMQCATAQTIHPSGSIEQAPVLTVSASIAPGVFHLVVGALPNAAAPPASPFIVAPSDSVPPPAGNHNIGTFTGDPKDALHPLVLKSAKGKAQLTLKTVASDGVSTILSFQHDTQDRFYGNGNESENHAGPLVHTSGKQMVNNGTTSLPLSGRPRDTGF